MRMVWWREVKWLIAGYLFNWMLSLIKDEISVPCVRACAALALEFKNDPKWAVVPMKSTRR